jgi:tetratricopeptide (TPR) repeat protein
MDQNMEEAKRLKDEGANLFKARRFKEALAKYQMAAQQCNEEDEAGAATWVTCKVNAALASINMHDYGSALKLSNAALRKDPNHVKGLYRRAVARNHLGMAAKALPDLTKALELEPNNKAVQDEIASTKTNIDKQDRHKRIRGYARLAETDAAHFKDKAGQFLVVREECPSVNGVYWTASVRPALLL